MVPLPLPFVEAPLVAMVRGGWQCAGRPRRRVGAPAAGRGAHAWARYVRESSRGLGGDTPQLRGPRAQLSELLSVTNRATADTPAIMAMDAEVAAVLTSAIQLPLPLLRAVGRTVANAARMAVLHERCLERYFQLTAGANGVGAIPVELAPCGGLAWSHLGVRASGRRGVGVTAQPGIRPCSTLSNPSLRRMRTCKRA